jgi:hypothetical protein
MTKLYAITMLFALPASAMAACANGVNVAGCVGPNGAASVNKNTGQTHSTSGSQSGQIKCADGVYRTACTGPNGGAAVIRR